MVTFNHLQDVVIITNSKQKGERMRYLKFLGAIAMVALAMVAHAIINDAADGVAEATELVMVEEAIVATVSFDVLEATSTAEIAAVSYENRTTPDYYIIVTPDHSALGFYMRYDSMILFQSQSLLPKNGYWAFERTGGADIVSNTLAHRV